MEAEQYNQLLRTFSGTAAYHSLKPLSNLIMTDGALMVFKLSSVISDIAIKIDHTPELAKEEFLAAKITVDANRTSKFVIEDGDNNELYVSGECHYELPKNTETLIFVQNSVIMLANEY